LLTDASHLPRSTFLSNDRAYWDRDNLSLFTDVTTRFDNGWTSNASVSLFDMIQQNRAYAIDNQPASCQATNRTCCEAAGEVRSHGLDTEISGALTPNWQFSAAYTLVLSQYVKDRSFEKGTLFAPNQLKHLF